MLRNIVKAVALIIGLAGSDAAALESPTTVLSAPRYSEWGRTAMQEAAKAYAGASIVDYKYEGRFQSEAGRPEERFLLRVRHDGREFGLRVRVELEEGAEKLHAVRMKEVER
jgi:hypothetical protein